MRRFTLMTAAIILMATTAAGRADRLPYLGGEPFNGSYWNGPLADYPYSAASRYTSNGYNGYNAYAMGSCRMTRTRHVTSSGRVFYRTVRICG